MKILNALITLIVMFIICKIYDIYCSITGKENKSKQTYIPFLEHVKKNNNRIYYVVDKYTNVDEKLTQKLSFYLPVGSEFKNVTMDVFAECKQPNFGNVTFKSSLYWEVTDFETIKLLQEVQKAMGKNIQLVRIDKDVVGA